LSNYNRYDIIGGVLVHAWRRSLTAACRHGSGGVLFEAEERTLGAKPAVFFVAALPALQNFCGEAEVAR